MALPQSQLRSYGQLFIPSALGVVFYVALTGLVIVLNQFGNIKEYLKVPASANIGGAVSRAAEHFLTGIFGEARTDALVVGSFWAVVGLLVYLMLHGLAKFVTDLDDGLAAKRYVWPHDLDRRRPMILAVQRFVFRLAAVLGLIIVLAGPATILLHGAPFGGLAAGNTTVRFVIWAVCGLLVCHIITILLRMIVLKRRLFN